MSTDILDLTKHLTDTEMKMMMALHEIINPVKYLQAEAEHNGLLLNKVMAIELGNDPHYLKDIAKKTYEYMMQELAEREKEYLRDSSKGFIMSIQHIKITKNGEITYSEETDKFYVWDESYSNIICETSYVDIAYLALEWYSNSVLGHND